MFVAHLVCVFKNKFVEKIQQEFKKNINIMDIHVLLIASIDLTCRSNLIRDGISIIGSFIVLTRLYLAHLILTTGGVRELSRGK